MIKPIEKEEEAIIIDCNDCWTTSTLSPGDECTISIQAGNLTIHCPFCDSTNTTKSAGGEE